MNLALPSKKIINIKYFDCILLLDLIMMALIRWIPGGDALNPESGIRGYIEIFVLSIALLFIWVRFGLKKFLQNFKSPFIVVLSLFSIWAMITAFWAPSFVVAMGKAYSFFAMVQILGVISQLIHEYGLSVTRIVLFGIILFILFIFFTSGVTGGIPVQLILQSQRDRLIFGYSHPNETANFFVIILFTGFIFLREEHPSKVQPLVYLLLALSVIGLFLTKSRTAMIGVLLSFGIYLIFSIRNPRLQILLIAIGGLAIVGVFFVIIAGQVDLDQKVFSISHFNFSLLSLTGRFRIWGKLFQSVNGVNLFGLGYFSPRYILLEENSWAYSAHNAFIEVYVATGLIGFFLLIIYYLLSFRFVAHFQKFPLQVMMLVFVSFHGMLEAKLFTPTLIMGIVTLLFLSGENSIRKEKDELHQS